MNIMHPADVINIEMDGYEELHNIGVMIRLLDQVEQFTGWNISSVPDFVDLNNQHEHLKNSFTQGMSWLAMFLLIEGLVGTSEN